MRLTILTAAITGIATRCPADPRPEAAESPVPRGQVTALQGVVERGVPMDLVENVVDARLWELEQCYDVRLSDDPALSGRLDLGWSLRDGHVDGRPYVIDASSSDPRLAACVIDRVRGWRFPSDATGDVAWRIVFTAR